MIVRILAVLGLLVGLATPAAPQPDPIIQVVWTDVSYTFGQPVQISARFEINQGEPTAAVERAVFYYLSPGKPVQQQDFDFPESLEARITLDQPLQTLRPFTTVYYWFEFTLTSGQNAQSPSFVFNYADNRYSWQHLESPHINLHWYDESKTFGEEALEVARTGLERLETILPLSPLTAPLELFIYQDEQDLLDALALGGTTWVTAYSMPDLGVALVSITPGPSARLEMEREIPHEIAHLMLYQLHPFGYDRLPTWLVEGLATYAELYPDSEDYQLLHEAVQTGARIPMAHLCQGLPKDPDQIELAYAQAGAFIQYLHEQYGTSGLQSLLEAYYDGKGCSQAPLAVFGQSLEDLEQAWLAEDFPAADSKPDSTKGLAAGILCGAVLAPPVLIGFYLWIKTKRTQGKEIK